MEKATTPDFFTPENQKKIADLLTKKYALFIKDKFFEVQSSWDSETVNCEIILRNNSESFYYPVCVRMLYTKEGVSRDNAAAILIDFASLYFDEYLTEGQEVFLPIDWSNYEYEGLTFQIEAQILNREAERLADELLAKHSETPKDLN